VRAVFTKRYRIEELFERLKGFWKKLFDSEVSDEQTGVSRHLLVLKKKK